MSTGYSYKIADAYGDLWIKMGRWDQGLRRADAQARAFTVRNQAAFDKLGRSWSAAMSSWGGMGRAGASVNRTTTAITGLAVRVNQANKAVLALNRNLGAMPTGRRRGQSAGMQIGSAAGGIGRGLGSFARGAGAGIGQAAVGLGRGLGHAGVGIGRGLGSGVSGFGRGIGSAMRGAAGLARAFASILARAAAGFGRLFMTSIRAAGGAVGMLLSPIRGAVGSLGRLGSMGGLVGGLGGAVGVGFTVKEAADREQAYRTLGRIAEVTGDAFARLKAKMEGTAASSTVHLGDLRKITEIGARQGIGGAGGMAGADALARFTKDLAKVKQALPDMDIEDAANGITRTLAVFRRGPRDILPFASALAAIDQASTATAGELLELTKRMSGVLGVLKATPAQALGLAAMMRDAGIEVETGGTAISTLLMKMASDSKKYAKAVGLDVRGLSHTIATDPVEAVRAWVEALSKFDPTEQIKILKSLHMTGRQSGQTILQLAAGYGKLGGFMKAANAEWKSLDAVNRASNDNLNNTWGQLARLGNQVKSTAADLGDHLLPVVKAGAGAMGEFLADVRASLDRNKATFEAWGARAGAAVRNLGLLWRSFPKFLDLGRVAGLEKLEQAGEVLKRLFGRFDGVGMFQPGMALRNLDVIAGNLQSILGRAFAEVGRFAGNLFSQVIDRMEAKVTNLIAGLPAIMGGGGKRVAVPHIDPGNIHLGNDRWKKGDFFGKRMDLMGGVKPLPGFRGLMANLPNRGAEKAGIWGGILADRRKLDAEHAAGRRAAAAEEAAARAKDLDEEREENRGRLEDARRRVALMRTGRERIRAVAGFRKQAAEWGFKGPDLAVPDRAAALGARNAAAAAGRRDAFKARDLARHRAPGRPAPAKPALRGDAWLASLAMEDDRRAERAGRLLAALALRGDVAARAGRLGAGGPMGKARALADQIRRRRESKRRNPVVAWGRAWGAMKGIDVMGRFDVAGRKVAGAMAPGNGKRDAENAVAAGVAKALGKDNQQVIALLGQVVQLLQGGIGLQ